ncbi:MAG: ParB/RepB/Spo0J family partition protein [Ruminococcaceae bacterium]|nr:ParB/RepB/Spo0J family partition protein [Oscillospiraceae bacterium]
MAKNKGLGRGLDAIFDENTFSGETEGKSVTEVSIYDIDPKANQPRKTFDSEALAQLADSISANGVLQPILVRKIGERYEIIAGERRFRASKLAGLNTVPVVIVDATDFEAAKYALIENIQREDLNPYEEAKAYREMIKGYGMNQEEIAIQIGKSRSAVANSLRLLDLPEAAAKLLADGSLSQGHARTLLGLTDKSLILPLAQRCISKELSVRELEEAVKSANKAFEKKNKKEESKRQELNVDYYSSLESKFTETTGRRCKITDTKKKKTFQIEYRDNEDLCELLEILAGKGFLDNL